MRSLCLLISLFCIWKLSFSQTTIASLELSRKDPIPRFFETSPADKGLITFGNMVRNSSRFLGLFKYDHDFKKQWSKQVLEQNGRNNVDFIANIAENIFVFVSEFFPKENAIRTFFYRYDLAGNLLDDRKLLSELSNEKEHRVDLKYMVSINRKTLLCNKNFNSAQGFEKVQYFVFDEEGTSFREGTLELPFRDEQLQIRKVLVSNEGNLFILGKQYLQDKVRSPEDFMYIIFVYETETSTLREPLELKFGDRYITDLNIKVDREENIFAAGFYSNRSTYEMVGTVFCKFNSAGEEITMVAEKFSDEFLAKFLTGRQIERGLELKYFYLDNIVLRSDGGVLLVAEKYYTTFSSMLDVYGYWVERQIHHYDEVIVNSVSSDGKIEWSTVVSKFQASENNINLSYFLMVTADGLHMIYEYSPRGMPETLYRNRIEMEGTTSEREIFMNSIGRNTGFFPRSSQQINNNEAIMVLYREKEKGYTIMRVDFRD